VLLWQCPKPGGSSKKVSSLLQQQQQWTEAQFKPLGVSDCAAQPKHHITFIS
jgi:hypothetical protein